MATTCYRENVNALDRLRGGPHLAGHRREMQYDKSTSKVPDGQGYQAISAHRTEVSNAMTELEVAMRRDLDVTGDT